MRQWQAVLIAGMIGGFFSTFLPSGTDVPFSTELDALLSAHKALSFFCHLMLNSIAGAIAGFALWAGLNPASTFNSMAPSPYQVATAGIVGGGGVSIVRNFFYQAGQAVTTRQAVNKLATATEVMNQDVAKLKQQIHVQANEEGSNGPVEQ
ncbi:MAG: hypothetical protein ACR2JC_11340 [Chloroflexota bacterium]|nr:MAG: hypothetical protein DLM70_01470 [Chloroflexota bacterium]